MSPDESGERPPGVDGGRCRWGIYFYLCRNTPRFASVARKEWDAITTLSVPPSVAVAVQQDTRQGARRWCAAPGSAPYAETVGRLNHGSTETARNFLTWAVRRAPSDRSVLVLAGTGVLDPWSIVGADGDPTRTFAICDDAGDRDALEVSELLTLFQDYRKTTRRPLDVLILDMSAMQWLEVAYQFHELVTYVVGAQTPVTPGPCPVSQLVNVFGAASPDAPTAGAAREAAEALSEAYQSRAGAPPPRRGAAIAPTTVSVLSLRSLEPVARAFDTFSHALMLALGEELIWNTRDAAAKQLRTHPFGSTVVNERFTSEFFARYAYDLVGLMQQAVDSFAAAQRGAVSIAVARLLSRLDMRSLFAELQRIDNRVNRAAAVGRGEATRGVPGTGYLRLLEEFGPVIRAGRGTATEVRRLHDSLTALASEARSDSDAFWIEWASDEGADREGRPSERLQREIEVTTEGCKHAKRLELLAARVLELLKEGRADASGKSEPLVVAKVPSESPACGLAVYRPQHLDTLLHANYLRLEFNRRSHWAALLAVINLVAAHPRAMWRVIESVLSTAPLDAREALLQRVFGPTSVVAGFRDQLKVLASPPLATLSISDRGPTTPGSAEPGLYQVRYTPCEPLAVIEQQPTAITVEQLKRSVAALRDVFRRTSLKLAHIEKLDVFGRILGEDVIQNLADNLETDRANATEDGLHLQLQLPRELMRYPWELMHDRGGRVADRYALARQVYVPEGLVRARPRVRHSNLRPLIIAGVPTSGREPPLHASLLEGERVASTFERLRAELGEVIEFDRKRDARIGVRLTVADVRQLLGSGKYDLVHFSGHGTFQENEPEKSGWVLSDDVLDVEAIRKTLSWSPKPPWLVYANACQSAAEDAVYQGDLHGLASAFITNGVAAYIGALWNVADLAGYLMAVEFYEALCLGRTTIGRALLRARGKVRALPANALVEETRPAELEVDALLALTSYSFVLFGDPTAKALEQIGTEPPEQKRLRRTRVDA